MTAASLYDGARALGVAVLLAGPAVVAFFSGGYFEQPRLWAALVACALLALAALTTPRPLPPSTAGRVALLGLSALAALTALSATWAASPGAALDDTGRLVAYAATLAAGAALLRPRAFARAVEPAIALGGLIVVGYGLSERVVPGLVDLEGSASAVGRLEQPLTYWNGMGALAAFALTACVRLVGDHERPRALRAGAAAAVPPLAAGLYLTFSRGSLAALAVGLALIGWLAPTRAQGQALALCLVGGLIAALLAAILPDVRGVDGAVGSRETGGAALGACLILLAGASALLAVRLADGADARRRVARSRLALVALPALVVATLAFVIAAAEERPAPTGAQAARLASVESSRYSYWKVAARSFADAPLLGAGSGSFRLEWRQHRDIPEVVRDAHSLPLETAAELGLAGLLALALFLGGVATCATRAVREDPVLAPGLAAVGACWAAVAALDWHWEMPAVTLPALLAMAALLARAGSVCGAPAGCRAPPPPARRS